MSGIYSSFASLVGSQQNIQNVTLSAPTFNVHLPHIKSRVEILRRVVDSGVPLIIIIDHYRIPDLSLNSRGIIARSPLDFLNPLLLPETQAFKGTEADYLGPTFGISDKIFRVIPYSYNFALCDASLVPLFRAPSRLETERRVVGGYRRTQDGLIVYAPPISDPASFPKYCAALLDLADFIARDESSSDTPAWALRLNLKREAEKKRKAAQHRLEAERHSQFAASLEDDLSASNWHSQLIASSGRPLEIAVQRAMKEMGIPCEGGPRDRADFLALWEDTILVGEVKGYDGATKEASLAQCKRWVSEVESVLSTPPSEWDVTQSEYAAILGTLGANVLESMSVGTKVKGVIISNNYRNIPPNARPDLRSRLGENFSDIFRANSDRATVAVMTSLQLLGMMSAFRENREEAGEYVRELIETNGIYCRFSDISEFLVEFN
jgi:hypothetical protein